MKIIQQEHKDIYILGHGGFYPMHGGIKIEIKIFFNTG